MNEQRENKTTKEEKKNAEFSINKIDEKAKASFKARAITAIILIITVIPCAIFGNYVFLTLIFLASVVATYEIIKGPQQTSGKKFKPVLYAFAYIMMFLLIFWIFIKNNVRAYVDSGSLSTYKVSLYVGFDAPIVSLSAFAFSVVFIFVMCLIDKEFTIGDAFYFIVMLFIVSIGFQSILYLRFYPFYENTLSTYGHDAMNDQNWFKYGMSMMYLLYMLLGTVISDAGAYIFGSLFGKHKLAPRISPHKTIEGFVWGYVLSFAITFTFGMLLAFNGYPILNILDKNHWYFILILSLLMPALSNFGDLLFSMIKRHLNIKDYGSILKGHGGIIDRLDSAFVTSIMLSLIVPLMQYCADTFHW